MEMYVLTVIANKILICVVYICNDRKFGGKIITQHIIKQLKLKKKKRHYANIINGEMTLKDRVCVCKIRCEVDVAKRHYDFPNTSVMRLLSVINLPGFRCLG